MVLMSFIVIALVLCPIVAVLDSPEFCFALVRHGAIVGGVISLLIAAGASEGYRRTITYNASTGRQIDITPWRFTGMDPGYAILLAPPLLTPLYLVQLHGLATVVNWLYV